MRSNSSVTLSPSPETRTFASRRKRRLAATRVHVSYAPKHREGPFARTIWGDPPRTKEQRDRLEFLYGSDLLFVNDDSSVLRHVPGTVLHNEPEDDAAFWLGDENPALAARALELKLSDKLEEYRFLADNAPDTAPPTVTMDDLVRKLGIDGLRTTDPRRFLVELQAELNQRFGRYILKPRLGFGSDGRLPTHKTDFGQLWDDFQRVTVPERRRLARKLTDPEELMEAIYEDVPFAEGLALEQLLADPSQLIAQQFVSSVNELRVHVVDGKILKGGTVGRWFDWDKFTTPTQLRNAERAVERLLENAAEAYPNAKLGFTMDVLVQKDGGVKIIDLNPGYQSGMYFAEWDLFLPHLLAEHYRGTESTFLHEFRAFQHAPLAQKLAAAKQLEHEVGRFVRENETAGFYDRVVDAYAADVARDRPTAEKLVEAFRQLAQLRGVDSFFLYMLLQDERVRPALAHLTLGQARTMIGMMGTRDDGATWSLVDPSQNGGIPFLRTELPEEEPEAPSAS